MSKNVKCPICGTEFEGGPFDDCPYCDWTYEYDDYTGEEEDLGGANPISYNQAKENFVNGLNVWGEPLPKR